MMISSVVSRVLVLLLAVCCMQSFALDKPFNKHKPLLASNSHNSSSTPVVDFFVVRTWIGDGDWMKAMLNSISQFVPRKMYRNIIVILCNKEEEKDFQPYLPQLQTLGASFHPVTDPPFPISGYAKGYTSEAYWKMRAHEFSDADYFIHIDTNVVFTRSVTLEDFVDGEKVNLKAIPYGVMPPSYLQSVKNVSEDILGFPCKYETTTAMVFTYPRELHISLQNYLESLHKRPLLKIMQKEFVLTPIGAYSLLGSSLMKFMPDRWIHAPKHVSNNKLASHY